MAALKRYLAGQGAKEPSCMAVIWVDQHCPWPVQNGGIDWLTDEVAIIVHGQYRMGVLIG